MLIRGNFSVKVLPVTAKDISKVVAYWLEASRRDLDVAKSLFRTGKYDYCLFLCHLSLEKMLKALAAKVLRDHPPLTHNLLYLAGKAGLNLSKAQIALLDQVNKFNMEVRYPEDLKTFHKRVNRAYASQYLMETKEIWKWLQSQFDR